MHVSALGVVRYGQTLSLSQERVCTKMPRRAAHWTCRDVSRRVAVPCCVTVVGICVMRCAISASVRGPEGTHATGPPGTPRREMEEKGGKWRLHCGNQAPSGQPSLFLRQQLVLSAPNLTSQMTVTEATSAPSPAIRPRPPVVCPAAERSQAPAGRQMAALEKTDFEEALIPPLQMLLVRAPMIHPASPMQARIAWRNRDVVSRTPSLSAPPT
jgi:hypothetical protein